MLYECYYDTMRRYNDYLSIYHYNINLFVYLVSSISNNSYRPWYVQNIYELNFFNGRSPKFELILFIKSI